MLSATTPTQPHEYTEMSRLADYFVVVGYDHEKESELLHELLSRCTLTFVVRLAFGVFLFPYFLNSILLFFPHQMTISKHWKKTKRKIEQSVIENNRHSLTF